MAEPSRVVVVGAGVGGLTVAAVLARAGLQVTVLEAHIYAGGCAGTFFHQGYRFDAGATLAGGFGDGEPMGLVARKTGAEWSTHPADPVMSVHLPDGSEVTRYPDERRVAERRERFGAGSDAFWDWQESTADAMWSLALRSPPWPPTTMREAGRLVGAGVGWASADMRARIVMAPSLAADALRPVAAHLSNADDRLKRFVDAQLLIAAQATSERTNALYGAAALDLPRRGVVHLEGGMGAVAEGLADAVKRNGGTVEYRSEVQRIVMRRGWPEAVVTKRGKTYAADIVVANLPPSTLARILEADGTGGASRLSAEPPWPRDGWGAFTVYLGVEDGVIPAGASLHQQVLAGDQLGEGSSVFVSVSPGWDAGRAPVGHRAVTLSTHTRIGPWWERFNDDRASYEAHREAMTETMLATAERAIPGLRDAAQLTLPGTPVTFQRFTRRAFGWVGGYPQTNLLRAKSPKVADRVWMVGDSIFPGQSTAAVALGGLRVARAVLDGVGGGGERRVVVDHSASD